MRAVIELPSKYYHSHFKELTDVLWGQYAPFFEENHRNFLIIFQNLSEDAQCLYLRMMNRKGKFFFKEKLRYAEIESFEIAAEELIKNGFADSPQDDEWEDFISFLPKNSLLELCREKNITLKKSASRDEIQEALLTASFPCQLMDKILVQRKQEDLIYLLFLYFGKIQENLALYTLRDLGIRQSHQKKSSYKVRFRAKDEALSHYFYSRLEYGFTTEVPIDLWPKAFNEETRIMRESILLALADEATDMERKLAILKCCEAHPGREKFVRLLFQLEKKDEAKQVLESILETPYSDIEYLFAEDFYARKFGGRKLSVLTETLRNARKIGIDESYFRHPERGVEAYLKDQGVQSYHLENYLWNCLFGILFWEELFESEKSSIFNEFERLPNELQEKTFHLVHEKEITEKLNLLKNKMAALELLLTKAEEKKNTVNGVFGWHESIPSMLEILISHANPESLASILIHMAKNFFERSSGFPDLMAVENGEIKFFEIKAPGDSLKERQLMQMIALQKAGFHVEVLQVEYMFNPQQLYVVVDIETTGGHLPYHRITELGAVKVRGGEVIEKFQTLVNPERRISREIEQLTGISNEMVATAPKFHEVAEAFSLFTQDCIFVAHNVAFDYGFIQSEYERLEQKFVRPYICTKVGIKKHYPDLSSYGLKNLCAHFGISLVNHHRALADAEAASELLNLINKKRAELPKE